MATIDLGRVTPIFHGDYDNTATYELNDLVIFNDDMYWHVSDTPTTGTDPTDATVWKLAIAGAAADLSIALAAFPTDTASGAIVSIPDGADNIPVKAMTVQIEPQQSGSGDPSPSNPRPISGWTGAEIYDTGINIWDEAWELGTLNSSGQNADSSSRIRCVNYVPVQAGTSYYCKSTNPLWAVAYDVNKNIISDAWAGTYYKYLQNSVFTAPTGAYYIRFVVETTTYNNDISINYPSTDTTYHSGTDNTTYTVPFGQTVYGGEVDPLNGEGSDDLLTATFNGFTSYTQGASFASGIMALPNAKSSGGSSTVEDLYCSMLKVDANPGDYACRRIDSTLRCYFPLGTSQADAEALIDGMVVAYPAATPTPFTVDPIQISTKYGDNNVWADCGPVELNYRADVGLYINKKLGA